MICQADERLRATCFVQILACPLQVSADSVLALLCETLGYIFMHAHTNCSRLPWVASPDARLVRAVARRRPHRLPVNNYLFMLRPLPPSLPLVVPWRDTWSSLTCESAQVRVGCAISKSSRSDCYLKDPSRSSMHLFLYNRRCSGADCWISSHITHALPHHNVLLCGINIISFSHLTLI